MAAPAASRDRAPYPSIPYGFLIDEYDNFANTILTHQGPDAYHSFTHGGGFYRNFFAALKTGTENGSIERYPGDGQLAQRHPEAEFTGLALVFCGWELVHAEAVPPPAAP